MKQKPKHEMARRKPVNLTLTEASIAMLEKLQGALNRPSKSNTVEALIADKARELKAAA